MSNVLYLGTNGYVLAVDMRSGDELWRTRLQSGFISATNSQDVSVLDHEGAVFAGCRGHLFCLDARTGEICWQSDLQGLGYNDVCLSIQGRTAQTKSPEGNSNSSS